MDVQKNQMEIRVVQVATVLASVTSFGTLKGFKDIRPDKEFDVAWKVRVMLALP